MSDGMDQRQYRDMTARHDKATVDQAIADVRRKWGGVTAREVVLADAVEELRAELDGERKFNERAFDQQKQRAKAAEAENVRLARQVAELGAALRMLWDHYLLPITDEQKAQVIAALATDKEPA